MRILSFSDIHGNFYVFEKSKKILNSADIVILSGDITHFGNENDTIKCLKELKKFFTGNIFAVTGNCDFKSAEKPLDQYEINLSEKIVEKNDFLFAGLKGSLVTPFSTPNEFYESDYEKMISKLESSLQGKKALPLVFVSHQPPFDCGCDVINSGMKTGSKAVRSFIEKNSPLVCFTGHIHEAWGIGKINNTIIINPGQAHKGNIGVLDFDKSQSDIYIETL
jgi:Icc-related predicted phosphoesterase